MCWSDEQTTSYLLYNLPIDLSMTFKGEESKLIFVERGIQFKTINSIVARVECVVYSGTFYTTSRLLLLANCCNKF